MKILYCINGMHFGGAARKVAMLTGELVRRGHEIHIATNLFLPIGFQLDPAVKRHSIYPEDAYSRGRGYRLVNVIKNVRRIVDTVRPDVIVSVLPHVSLYVRIATIGSGIPIVFSDETSFARKDSLIDYMIRKHLYYFADAVVILTHNDAEILGSRIPKKVVINNPVIVPSLGEEGTREKIVMAIGPLFEWHLKGFDMLFDAFASLRGDFPEWRLMIVGAKDEVTERNLREMAKKKGINDILDLPGFRSDIYSLMKKTEIYALTSRAEGFSLSLVEAMSQGCACVAFRCHGVIEEVTQGGNGVLLVNDGDVSGLTDALRRNMANESLRRNLASKGLECLPWYDVSFIASEWEKLFNRLSQVK